MSADDYDFERFIDPVLAVEGFEGVFDQRQITIRTYSTNLPFERQRIEDALRRAWMGPTTPLGVVQFLSSPDEPDVRVVIGLQGESRVRTFDYETHRARWWAWRATIRETVAIRYRADEDGMLRFTTLGGGQRIKESGVKEFHSLVLEISKDTTRAMAFDPNLLGLMCFEPRFLWSLYSLKARLLNADRYGSIEHAEFVSSRFLDPDCEVLKELREMDRLPVESFESMVKVGSAALGDQDVRFALRAASGSLRLKLPKLEPAEPFKDSDEQTRAFYDFVEAAAAEIVRPDLYVDLAEDPAKLEGCEELFPVTIPTGPYRDFLRTARERDRWLGDLDVFAPRGTWVPHLHALDELLAGELIAEQLREVVDRLVLRAPRHAVGALRECERVGWTRLGSVLRDRLVARMNSLPTPTIPLVEDAVFDYSYARDRSGWDVEPERGEVLVHGLAFTLDDLPVGTAGHALITAVRCLHERLVSGEAPASLMRRATWAVKEMQRRCAGHDVGDDTVALVAVGGIPQSPGEYRAHRPGAPPVATAQDLDERLLRTDRLPLWPHLEALATPHGWQLTNSGVGTAYAVRISDEAGPVDLPPGATINRAWREGESRPSSIPVSLERYGRSYVLDLPIERVVDAGPLFLSQSVSPAQPGPRILTRRDIARRLERIDKAARPVGMSRRIWGVYEAMIRANVEVAGKLAPVLLLGETGVGKTRMFTLLHALSSRGGERPEHANGSEAPEGGDPNIYRGSWLGYGPGHGLSNVPKGGMGGRIELAARSSFFIDDCEKLSKATQADLRALLDGRPVQGLGQKTVTSTTRFVFATNKDPDQLVADNLLLHDLLARIPESNRILIPPLRDRPTDILALARTFANAAGVRLTHRAWLALYRSAWPTNVRQLELAVEAAARNAAIREQKTVDLRDFGLDDAVAQALEGTSENDCEREVWVEADRLARVEWEVEDRGAQTVVGDILGVSEGEVSKTYKRLGLRAT